MIESILVKNLKELRKQQNLTQEKLGEMADLSHRYYQQIEAGGKWPSAQTIENLAKALKVEPSALFRNNSKGRFKGELSLSDASEILAKISNLLPGYRSVVLALIFEDPSLVQIEIPESDKLKSFVQTLSKAR